MSRVDEIVSASQYTIILTKKVKQRDEHLISAMTYEPKYFRWCHVFVSHFSRIPSHFDEIFRAMETEGRQLNGTRFGVYALCPHGRGKVYGIPGKECRYRKGAIVDYDSKRGLIVRNIKFHHRAFDKLLKTVDEVNAKLLNRNR